MRMKKFLTSFILRVLVLSFFSTNLFHIFPPAFTAEAPQANFKFTPVIPYVTEIVTFDASTSTPGEGYLLLYRWEFGDNTTAIGMYVDKSFLMAGDYSVTLTVTNSAGENDTTSKTITVLPNPDELTLDLYNQRGGEGRNQPSGDFAPGEIVFLTALVTYRSVPVEYKLVSFEVRDAMGQTVFYRSALTDENGFVRINFTIQGTCLPNIFGTWIVYAVVEVSGQKASDTLTFFVTGPFLDIYTQKPEPYSGKGPYQPSDAFAPQEEVILYGAAHWCCEPVENKFVAFEIIDPAGNVIDYRVNATNDEGIAMVSFRLGSNATFGIYTVFGIVEILGKNASDVLAFRVGWLVELLAVETLNTLGSPESIFAKEEHVCFNITVRNIAFTAKKATFTIAVSDAEKVPIGTVILGNWMVPPGVEEYFLISVQIPKWAFTGGALACANAYTNLPKTGGVPYCPEVSTPFIIVP